jgi:hypothetical protein
LEEDEDEPAPFPSQLLTLSFLPPPSEAKSLSAAGVLWNLRVSCHANDEGSLFILPATPKRAVAAREERNIFVAVVVVVTVIVLLLLLLFFESSS